MLSFFLFLFLFLFILNLELEFNMILHINVVRESNPNTKHHYQIIQYSLTQTLLLFTTNNRVCLQLISTPAKP